MRRSKTDWHDYEINPWPLAIALSLGLWLVIGLCVKAALA
jgi:hypothetical protein